MDFETDFLPVWVEPEEVYYKPEILERELEKINKEYAETKYQCSELIEENKLLTKKINATEKEKTDLHKLYKQNTINLPIYQSKVLESNKVINQLSTEKKNLLMAITSSKEKRDEIEKKYKDVTDRNLALMTTNHRIEKTMAKIKLEKAQELKDKLRTEAENEKIKATADDLEIQNKTLITQISHHADELRSIDILVKGLERDKQMLMAKVENTVTQLKDLKKCVKDLEEKNKLMNKECSDSILKYASLVRENNNLRIKSNEVDALKIKLDEVKINERADKRQNNMLRRTIIKQDMEIQKLKENILILEKQKTRFIYTGEDMTVLKRKLAESEKQKLALSEKFSNLADCPFYRSKLGKIEDKDPKIKFGPITERHYESKIIYLEQVIQNLHLKFENQEKKHLQYRDIVTRCLYDARRAEKKEKDARVLIEKQKYKIIYDQIDVLAKDSKIQKLEIQKSNCDSKVRLCNRQSTLLCRQIRNDYKIIDSMKKDFLRANKVIKVVEQKKEEIKHKTEQSEKSKEILKTQLEYNNKCQKRQQLEANKMKSIIEEFQKKIGKMQNELNCKKQKIEELTSAIAQSQTKTEFDKKIQAKNINDANKEIGKLNIQNKSLIFENKCLLKFKEDNNILKSILKTEEQNFAYLKKKYDKLYSEKQQNISLKRIAK